MGFVTQKPEWEVTGLGVYHAMHIYCCSIGRLYEDIFLYIVATLELVRLDQLPPPKCFSKLDPSFGGFVAFHQTAIFLKDVLSWSSVDEVSGIKATAVSMSDSRHFIRTLNPGVATG